MAIIKHKEHDKETKEIDTRLQLINELGQVKSDVKDIVTSDYVYAKLNEEDKKYITEMYDNADYSRRVMQRWATTATTWHWNQQQKRWEQTQISQYEQQIIKKLAQNTITAYTVKCQMLAILNRNVPKNYMINASIEHTQDDNEEEEKTDKKDIKQQLAKLTQNEEKK